MGHRLDIPGIEEGKCFRPNLNKIAFNILSMPVTTASTEKSFSTYRTHSAKCKKLTTERAGEQAHLYHNSRLLRSVAAQQVDNKIQQDLKATETDNADDFMQEILCIITEFEAEDCSCLKGLDLVTSYA